MKANTTILVIGTDDCAPDMLDSFNRHQEVNHCWRNENGTILLKNNHYIETWDNLKKQAVIQGLKDCIQDGGKVICVFKNGSVIGFASVDGNLLGSCNQYANLSMLHISYECRNQGLGKKLFAFACEQAAIIGANKLYISAHSSEESIAFYRKVGCVDAVEVDPKMAEEEPCDLQLEYSLLS